jgi:hypothetical protein
VSVLGSRCGAPGETASRDFAREGHEAGVQSIVHPDFSEVFAVEATHLEKRGASLDLALSGRSERRVNGSTITCETVGTYGGVTSHHMQVNIA